MSDSQLLDMMWTATALGVALFALCAICIRRIAARGTVVYLDAIGLFMAIQVLDLADDLAFGPPIHAPLWLLGWQDVLLPLFMVCLWFFVRGLTEPAMRLTRSDLWHLLPLIMGLVLLLPFLALPGDVRAGLYVDADLSGAAHPLAEFGVLGFWLGWIAVLVGYGLACARRLTRHKRNTRKLFSDLDGKDLWWLDALVGAILLLAWLIIADELAELVGGRAFMVGWVEGLYEIMLGLVVGLFALRATPPLPDWSAEVLDTARPSTHAQPASDPTDAPPRQSAARYARSGLQPDDLTRMARRLEARMSSEQLWRDPMLSLKSLSDATGISAMHLSEVLNTQIGKTFFDYVNGLRIEDACARLASGEAGILEISEAVGFNSKSSFNANFKRITGQTPTAWRAAMRDLAP